MFALALLAAVAIGCADEAPVEPTDSWCAPEAAVLLGEWKDQKEVHGHTYDNTLTVEETDQSCLFSFRLLQRQDGIVRLDNYGEMLVTHIQQFGHLTLIRMEGRRLLLKTYDEQGKITTDEHPIIYQTAEAKVWNDLLVVWGIQFEQW